MHEKETLIKTYDDSCCCNAQGLTVTCRIDTYQRTIGKIYNLQGPLDSKILFSPFNDNVIYMKSKINSAKTSFTERGFET